MQKTAIVTGANSGLGLEITRQMASRGYRAIMACRNLDKAAAARDKLLRDNPQAQLEVAALDVSSLDSVAAFAENFGATSGELDLLFNNAGITGMELARNDRGHESHLATNHLGPFALVGYLLPRFREGAATRIINVNSLAHRAQKAAGMADLNWERDKYDPMDAYGRSKFAFMIYTLELQRRLQANGANIIAVGAHPGFANTEIMFKEGSAIAPKNWLGRLRTELFKPLIPLPEKAARPMIHAALADDVSGGEYYGPGGLFEIAGKPGPAKINPAAMDAALARDLWHQSEVMTGVSYLD